MKISLTKNQYALIDDADFDLVSKYKWQYNTAGDATSRIYVGKVNGKYVYKNIKMHRIIMGEPKGMDIDHINGDRLDNRRSNLRICTRSQNLNNKRGKKNTSSIYKGVSWYSREKLWGAEIGKTRIGYFKEERHAAMAYDIWAKENFGEYAKLNFN